MKYNTNTHLKGGSKMGRYKAAHALRSAEDLPLGQILIPTHKDGIWYYTRPEIAKMLSCCFDGLCKDMLEAREIKYYVLCLKTFVTKSFRVDCDQHLYKDAILELLVCSPEQDLGSSLVRRGLC